MVGGPLNSSLPGIYITMDGDIISHLLYADDLILLAANQADLQTLINCLVRNRARHTA